MKKPMFLLFAIITCSAQLSAEEPATLKVPAPQGWAGERISLPPSFAKDMKLKGVEMIRFAPGMFDPSSASFFSYVIVFQVEQQPLLTKEVLRQELLAYYRGLATAVGKPKKKDLDVGKFRLQLRDAKSRRPHAIGYVGEMNWIEPFRTLEAQTLNLEVDVWNDDSSKRAMVFIAVSPSKQDAEIWQQMRRIRTGFFGQEGSK